MADRAAAARTGAAAEDHADQFSTFTGPSIADEFTANTSVGPRSWVRTAGLSTAIPTADGAAGCTPPRRRRARPRSVTAACSCTSTNTPFDVTEPGDRHGYTKFRAYAVLDHDGDMSAAARALKGVA